MSRPCDKLRLQAEALGITKPAMRQLALRWPYMKPLALLCMLNEIKRERNEKPAREVPIVRPSYTLEDKQAAMRDKMARNNYRPVPKGPKMLIRRREKVLSVGKSSKPGFRKLTLECGHTALSCSEMAPYSVECGSCGAAK
jgi:hypothetical protein